MEENRMLKELEDFVAEFDEISNLDGSKTISNIRKLYESSEEKLFNLKLNHNGYDEVEFNEKNENRERELAAVDSLQLDLSRLEIERSSADRLVTNLETAIKHNSEVYSHANEMIAEYEEYLRHPNISLEDKELCNKRIQLLNDVKKKIDDEREATNSKLSSAKAEQEIVNRKINDKRIELDMALERALALEKEIKKLQELGYEEAVNKAEADAQTLYFAYNFFSANPKEEIQNTINDYKDGIIDLKVLNERLQNLKVLLNSGIYDINTINQKVREKRLHDIEDQLEAQKKIVYEENNIESIENQIIYYKDLIKKESKQAFVKRYENLINSLEVQREELMTNGKGTDKLRELELLHMSYIAKNKADEKVFTNDLDNLIKLTGGEVLVEKEGRQVPNYFPEEYLQLLDKAVLDRANSEINDLVEKEVTSLPEEDKIDVRNKINDLVDAAMKQVKDENGMIPLKDEEKGLIPIDGPRIEVTNTKDLEQTKLDKIKEWFNKNWKKVTLTASVIALALGITCSSCSGIKKNNSLPNDVEQAIVDVHIPNLEEVEVSEEQTPAVEEQEYEETKEVKPIITPKPTEKPTPTPEESSDPVMDGTMNINVVTPNPDTPNIGGDSKYADNGTLTPPQLGDGNNIITSAFDDSIPGQTTLVDVTGNAHTVYSDGHIESGHNEQTVDENGKWNPNFTPVERVEEPKVEVPSDAVSLQEKKQQVEEENKKIEEKAKENEITQEEAEKQIATNLADMENLQSAFDEDWENEPLPGQSKGGR